MTSREINGVRRGRFRVMQLGTDTRLRRCLAMHTTIAKLFTRGLFALTLAACSSSQMPDEPEQPEVEAASAPTYEELFAIYFDKGTPGHCATAGCHADPGHNVWLCMDAESCYQGMIEIGLINPADPTHSDIANPTRSELSWVNRAGGDMPLDAQGENPEGRDAIEAWVAAGAQR